MKMCLYIAFVLLHFLSQTPQSQIEKNPLKEKSKRSFYSKELSATPYDSVRVDLTIMFPQAETESVPWIKSIKIRVFKNGSTSSVGLSDGTLPASFYEGVFLKAVSQSYYSFIQGMAEGGQLYDAGYTVPLFFYPAHHEQSEALPLDSKHRKDLRNISKHISNHLWVKARHIGDPAEKGLQGLRDYAINRIPQIVLEKSDTLILFENATFETIAIYNNATHAVDCFSRDLVNNGTNSLPFREGSLDFFIEPLLAQVKSNSFNGPTKQSKDPINNDFLLNIKTDSFFTLLLVKKNNRFTPMYYKRTDYSIWDLMNDD